MNNQAGASLLFSQLAYQIPVFIVYLVAMIMALVHINRATTPALLTLLGVALLAVTSVGFTVLQSYLISSRQNLSVDFRQLMMVLAIGSRCLSAIGLGLLVAAIFVGRGEVPRADSDLQE